MRRKEIERLRGRPHYIGTYACMVRYINLLYRHGESNTYKKKVKKEK